MNDNYIEIKEQRKGIFTKGLSLLAFMIISLTVALFPYLSEFAMKYAFVFFIIGGIAFIAFTTMFVFLLYKECNPDNALILTSNNFIDINNVGNEIEIEWTNVSSVKVLGKGAMPFLGIVLENSDIVMAKMKKTFADKMRKNIEDGLPAILIAQSDVRMPIKDLRDIFIKFVREARYLQNDTPKRTKTNPFSTDDVLRAFGKLPKEQTDQKTNEEAGSPAKAEHNANDSDTFYESLCEAATQSAEPIIIEAEPDDDKKYESHDVAPVLIPDTTDDEAPEAEEDEEAEDMPEEIKEILSRAKLSKISELGKILSEDDIPYSLSRTETNTKTQDSVVEETEANSNKDLEEKTEAAANGHTVAEPSFVIPKDIYNEEEENAEETSFELKLNSMLKNAFEQSEKEESERDARAKESNGDGDFYPDLVLINDSDFEDDDADTLKKHGDYESDGLFGDFITSIDDD